MAAGTVSNELEVEPGEHFLRAGAVLKGEGVWVWAVNEVPAGQVCTWTITDPLNETAVGNNNYQTVIAAGSKRKNIKSKQRE